MKLVILLVAALAGAVGAIHTALYGPRAQARKRLREASRELADGAVATITGKVVPKHKILEAPLSGREGVAFSSVGRVYGGSGRRPEVVATVSETMMIEFELETKDGTIVVEGESAQIEFPPEPLIPRKIEREQKFLNERGYSHIPARGAGFDEVVIAAGMKVSVHGVVRIEAAPVEGTYREAGRKIVVAGHPSHPLTIGRPV